MVCVWRSENNLQELVVSFYHIGLRDQTQVIWIAPNSFSHLTNFLILYHLLILIHCLMLLIDFKIFYTYIHVYYPSLFFIKLINSLLMIWKLYTLHFCI